MTPPVALDSSRHYRAYLEVPLGQWTVSQAFDTAAECNSAASETVLEANRELNSGRLAEEDRHLQISHTQAQCIASDDPRLAH
jgi:hypothetical protein